MILREFINLLSWLITERGVPIDSMCVLLEFFVTKQNSVWYVWFDNKLVPNNLRYL